jgi:predicted dehydrogenase
MADQVRVGFVGTGGIATGLHMKQLKEIPGVEFVAQCDTQRARAEAASQQFGGRVYQDHHEMLEREQMDALYVCLPPDAHTDAEIIAAQKKIHLFVEKPVVMTMEKGKEIWRAIKKAKVISCVGYQMRYTPAAAAARQFLAGKPVALVAGHRFGGIAGGPEHWWRVMERSGGMFHEQATHQMDMIRYLVGEVARVCAHYSLSVLRGVENLTIPDAQAVVMEFRNGATGYFACSCALTQGGYSSGLEVVLRDMVLKFGQELTVVPEGAAKIELPAAGMNIDQAFIHAIRTRDRSVIRSDYYDALKTTEVTLAANKSAETGRPVAVKLR